MHTLSRNPYDDFERMREGLRHLFPDSPLLPMQGQPYNRMPGPSVDIRENDKEITVSAEIPGIDPEELDVTVDETQVTIRGKIKRGAEREREGYRMMERRYGTFSRTIPLPAEVKPDEAWTDYHHGVLEIHLNKAEGGRVRSIKLNVNTDRQ
ncbi:MAG: Hsp20/alpha crystallin family protein [Clostridiales bacterium]|jgi:HSP20 family protein|nr:Hsp20/alpha crystallin family protein [Clostridiales bacterium]